MQLEINERMINKTLTFRDDKAVQRGADCHHAEEAQTGESKETTSGGPRW